MADARYRPTSARDLAAALGVQEAEFHAFEQTLRLMLDAGQVLLGPADTVALPPPGPLVTGVIRVNPKGFGFIVPDSPMEHGDIFVPPGRTGDAMDGDRVKARIGKERRPGPSAARSPYVATVIEVLQRADNRFVGNLARSGALWVVQVDGKQVREPLTVRDPSAKNAKTGDKVVVEILKYPTDDSPGEGVIVEVLGGAGEPDVETLGVVRAYGLRDAFPKPALDEARAAARAFESIDPFNPAQNGQRLDLTGEFVITIDPPDARDYDDAIHLKRLESQPDGAVWELGVHIADVSHFVQTGSALDTEAYERGNSTYLPRKVLPMLPELLSNGVCSLQEAVPRFCISAFMRYDRDGKVLSSRFARTVIRSNKRLTYLEAQALIDDDLREAVRHAKTEPKYPRELIERLKLMDELAKVILERRRRAGMIELALPEVVLVFDDSGRVTDAQPEDGAFTHRLIEMFMVEANEAAARLFDAHRVPMIRRIHPEPPSHDTNELRQFARVAGVNVPANPTRKELQGLLNFARGKPSQHAVHLAVLQTLSQAEYSPMLVGHFALASDHYTHFTSPIRRYPDFVVHRGLATYLRLRAERAAADRAGRDLALTRPLAEALPDEVRLHEMARHCSTTERNSAAAEKDLRNYLVLELLSHQLGEDFEGTVTGITGSGLFVQINRYLVDGFIRLTDVAQALSPRGERWMLNRTTGGLVAQRSGKTITIGDRFLVRVANVDPVRRVLDLAILRPIEGPGASPASGASPRPPKPAKPIKPMKPGRRQPKGAREGHGLANSIKKQDRRRGRRGR